MSGTATRWYFNARPAAAIEADTLVLREEPIPALRAGEILVRTLYLSMDATNRVWISDWDIYMDPVRLGEPMRGFVVGEVMESRNDAFPAGKLVAGLHTWSDYFVTDARDFQSFEPVPGLPLADAFGILTVAGPTAHYGLLNIGRPKAGDTVVVTAAAGAVGSLVGQIARLKGCRPGHPLPAPSRSPASGTSG
jgi:NADPH-dependent curcumin reductase CurA